jgi:integrase
MAIAKRDGLRRQLQLGVNLAAQSRTVATWLTEWLTDIKAHDDTRASTLRRYSEVVNTHLIPGTGRTRLDRLTPRDVQRLIGSLRDRVTPATVVKLHGVLSVALSDAERLDLVPRNVAKAAKPPGLGRNERRALTPDEAKRLLAAMIEKRHEPLFMVALSTGLRRGELLALRWSDVDLESGRLFVRRALQRTEGRLQFVQPKTYCSAGAVPLSALTLKALERQRVAQAKERLAAGELWQAHDLVFASTIGTPLEPRNVNRVFYDRGADAGLPWLRLHDLRHAFATFLIDQGEELRTVMELLGHSTIRLTADTYGHVLAERARKATSAIDRILGEESA